MDTKDYIKTLHNESLDIHITSHRQALCYYLYMNHISCRIISQVLGCHRRSIYKRVYTCRDLLDAKDKTMIEAMNELNNHKIVVRPTFLDGDVISRFAGYKMLIDNQIY